MSNTEVLLNAPQNLEVLEQRSMSIESVSSVKRFIGRAALVIAIGTAGGVAGGAAEMMNAEAPAAYATTTFVNDYPNLDAVEHNKAQYEWWVDENGDGQKQIQAGANDELMSPRGFDYRNCTDGVSYWVKKYTGVTLSGASYGNANNWDSAASSYEVDEGTTNDIEPGDIAQSDDGSFGHVGFVTSVTKNAMGEVTSFTTAELNKAGNGEYDTPTYSTRNASNKFKRNASGTLDWDHFIDVNGDGKGLNNEPITGGGGGGGSSPGPTTLGLYNPGNAFFYERDSNTPGAADRTFQFGNPDWVPLTGDWDNDGKFTPGAYDPTTGYFYLRNSNTPGPADTSFQYGNSDWIPIAGDWNGNGYWSVGMYRPENGTFYLRNTNSSGAADLTFQFGNHDWVPITGDWNNDGVTTIGVYDPDAAVYYLNDSNDGGAAENTVQYGNANQGWIPIAGDWNGNGYWSIGAYNPATSTFYLRNMNSNGPADVTVQYGLPGWKPAVGDWQ